MKTSTPGSLSLLLSIHGFWETDELLTLNLSFCKTTCTPKTSLLWICQLNTKVLCYKHLIDAISKAKDVDSFASYIDGQLHVAVSPKWYLQRTDWKGHFKEDNLDTLWPGKPSLSSMKGAAGIPFWIQSVLLASFWLKVLVYLDDFKPSQTFCLSLYHHASAPLLPTPSSNFPFLRL